MSDLNVDSIFVLSALDKLMSEQKANPTLFCKLFEKKKLIIDMIQSHKIDGKKYKAIIAKCMKEGSELVKACAVSDAMKLKDAKDQTMINRWFEEMINATGESYQLQQKLYGKYQSMGQPQPQAQKPPPVQPQKPQQPQQPQKEFKQVDATQTQQIKVQPKKPASEVSGATSSVIGGINIEEIVSFRVADNLLQKYEENRQFYERFLQRKKKLLELVNNKLINGDKYKANIVYAQSKIKNEEMLSDMKFELDAIEDFHDGNVETWFKDVVSETKDALKEQEQHLIDLSKGKSIKKASKQISLEVQAQSKIKQSDPIDLKEAITFKVIEEQLQNNEDNKANYKILLEKKKNLLDLVKKGALTADKYKALVSKSISQVINDEVKESMTMELTQIEDLHDGNVQEWFKDVISNAELFLEDQIKKLAQMEKGVAPQKSKHSKLSDQELNMSDEEEVKKEKPSAPPSGKAPQPQNVSQGGKVLIDFKELYSLKAIDEYLEQYEKTPQIYCLCFERKLQIFEMMKNGEITPEKYKSLQQKTFKNTQNEKLRDVVEMDLVDLKDICDNNVNEWFEGVINDTGMSFEDQQALYKKYSNKGSTATQAKKGSSIGEAGKKEERSLKIAEKPVINDVVCFTAIFKLFMYAVQRVEIIYYKELQLKRQKLIELVSLKKLVPSAYRKINQAAASKTGNEFLKSTILEEEARLKGQFKGNEQSWFESLATVLKSPPPELILPENKEMKRINASPSSKKVEYFLRSMAGFECLFYYYKKNKIPIQSNKYLEEYQKKKRKEVIHCLDLIQKDPTFDVYNLTQQMFPEINNDIFYGENLAALKQKAQSYIPLIAKEIASLKDYSSKIKKATNTQNLENVKKQIAKCEENIAFLKSWPSGTMVPLPIITEQKIQKYNLDVNSKLDKNEIQVSITHLAGLTCELIMNVYVVDHNKQRYSAKANNGAINAKFVVKLNEKEMFEVCKGDKRHIAIKFFKRGFFGGLSLMFEGSIETIFARNNIIEEKTTIGEVQLSYVLKVNKPTKPLITEIMHYQVVQLPKYKHDKFVEDEIIKKYSMYSSPTPSEIIAVDP